MDTDRTSRMLHMYIYTTRATRSIHDRADRLSEQRSCEESRSGAEFRKTADVILPGLTLIPLTSVLYSFVLTSLSPNGTTSPR